MLKDTLQADLKTAMLARDTDTVEVLKGLKSAVLYAEVEAGKRDEGLSDEEILIVFKKESKKRQDSIDLYLKGGNSTQADKETTEKAIIDAYLPEQLSEEEIRKLVEAAISELGIEAPTKQDMGRIIGTVKARAGAEADGSVIAKCVNERIS